jgi:hypothetical protein
MSVTLEGCGKTIVCDTGGYSIDWDDTRCDLVCSPGETQLEQRLATPLAPGSRLARPTVRQMRRGALRQLLDGTMSKVEGDQEFIDPTLQDASVAEVVAMLEQ